MQNNKRIYRARDGVILGVCLGLARAWGLPAPALRLLAIVLVLSTGVLPGVGLYVLAALILEVEPSAGSAGSAGFGGFGGGREDWRDRFRRSPESVLAELKERTGRLDRRLRDMEDRVTRSGFDWEQRFRR